MPQFFGGLQLSTFLLYWKKRTFLLYENVKDHKTVVILCVHLPRGAENSQQDNISLVLGSTFGLCLAQLGCMVIKKHVMHKVRSGCYSAATMGPLVPGICPQKVVAGHVRFGED